MMKELNTHANLDGYDIDIVVYFDYFVGCPGDRCTPPSGGSIDIMSIVDEDGQQRATAELSAKDFLRIEEECIIKFEDQYCNTGKKGSITWREKLGFTIFKD